MRLAAHGSDLFRLCANVMVRGHTDIGMPGDWLQEFDIAALARRVGEVAVPEHVNRRAV